MSIDCISVDKQKILTHSDAKIYELQSGESYVGAAKKLSSLHKKPTSLFRGITLKGALSS